MYNPPQSLDPRVNTGRSARGGQQQQQQQYQQQLQRSSHHQSSDQQNPNTLSLTQHIPQNNHHHNSTVHTRQQQQQAQMMYQQQQQQQQQQAQPDGQNNHNDHQNNANQNHQTHQNNRIPHQNHQNPTNSTPINHSQCTYDAIAIAGSGSFGMVYQARVIDPYTGRPGEVVAIKRVFLDPEFKNRELQIMTELETHPSVIGLRHCFYTSDEVKNRTYLNIVMDYFPGNLYKHIRDCSRKAHMIPTSLVRRYIYQILRGLAYIHDKGICHRDLKPHNVLINQAVHEVRICDFGSAKRLSSHETNVSYICSRYYRAPELALGANYYGVAVDIWSAGCVFAEILNGRPLFSGSTSKDQIVCILKILGLPRTDDYPGMKLVEQNALDSIQRAIHDSNQQNNQQNGQNNTNQQNLSQNSQQNQLIINSIQDLNNFNGPNTPLETYHRNQLLSLKRAMGDHCPPESLDLLLQLLRFDPLKRISAFEALAHPFFNEIHRPNELSLDSDLFHWEINQHQWTDNEAVLISRLPVEQRAVLFPLWLKHHSTRRIQQLVGADEIFQYQLKELKNGGSGGNGGGQGTAQGGGMLHSGPGFQGFDQNVGNASNIGQHGHFGSHYGDGSDNGDGGAMGNMDNNNEKKNLRKKIGEKGKENEEKDE